MGRRGGVTVVSRMMKVDSTRNTESPLPNADWYARPRWRWILLAWSVPAIIGAAQTSLAIAVRPTRGIRLISIAPREGIFSLLDFLQWMSWALVTPAIFTLVRRVPLRRGQLWPAAAVHVAAALLVAFIIESVWYGVRIPFRVQSAPVVFTPALIRQLYLNTVANRVVASGFIYIAIVGAATAIAYQRRLHDRELRAAFLEAELSSARLQTLKMQLHPHFLFNALHAVTVLIRDNPGAATRMVAQLGDLLRLSLARVERARVTFREELDLLRLYLDIEAIRFRDRLNVEYDIHPATMTALVPDLLLQPLAENAIRHGVSRSKGKARIRVCATRVGSDLVMEIHDTGRGPDDGVPRENVGLGSTRRRLAALYGDHQELALQRSPTEGGCLARVRIPFEEAPADLGDVDADDIAGRQALRA
jgi:two-component system LytT family sensor kinase